MILATAARTKAGQAYWQTTSGAGAATYGTDDKEARDRLATRDARGLRLVKPEAQAPRSVG